MNDKAIKEEVKAIVNHAKFNVGFVPDPKQPEWSKNLEIETNEIMQLFNRYCEAAVGEALIPRCNQTPGSELEAWKQRLMGAWRAIYHASVSGGETEVKEAEAWAEQIENEFSSFISGRATALLDEVAELVPNIDDYCCSDCQWTKGNHSMGCCGVDANYWKLVGQIAALRAKYETITAADQSGKK